MIKSDKGKKVFGLIPILAIIVSVFGGVVSAVDFSGEGVTQSVTDAGIQTAVGNPSSEELAEALDAVTDDTVNIEFADQSAELGVVSSRSSYVPQVAVNYADSWWNGRNPNYHDYSSSGGDCANFVSQCLIAGGLDLSVCDSCTWIDDKGCLPRCRDLHTYLVDYLHATWETKPRGQVEPLEFVPGDPAIFGYSDAHPRTHAVFAVTGDATHYATCNAHSSDAYHVSIENFYNANPSFDRCTFYHIPTVQKPTVETRSATSITETAATLNGEITDDGGASIDERGLLWGEGDTLTDLTKDVTISGNHFSFCLTGLKPDTKYSFMAYAKNSAGTGEGNILSFRTECPTPGTPSNPSPSIHAADVSINTDLDWSDCSNTDFYDVYFGTSSPPPYYGSAPTSNYPFQNDLEYNTKYYWKIVAKSNCGGITQGSIWDFTTEENPNTCDGTDTSCGIYPNCEKCNNYDGWYCNGNTREYRDFYCSGTSCTYTVTSSDNCDNYDGWVDTGNTRWEDVNECKEKEQKEQEYRDYACSGGSCTYSVTDTQWLDTGNTQNKPDGTDCGSDGWVDTGNTRWENVNECQEKEQKEQEYRDYACSNGVCTYSVTDTQWLDTGNTQNKPDGTICGCTASNTLKKCNGGICTDTGICDSTNCDADAACDGKEPGDSCGGGICNSTCKCVPECGNMAVDPTSWSPTINCGESDNEIITVSATGGTVEGVTVSKISGPTWLSVSPTDLGDITSGSSKTFTITAAPPSETSGDFPYSVTVSNTCGTPSSRDVTGTITVYCPELSYSPAPHDFGDRCEGEKNSTTFEIWNSGTGTLTYSLSETCDWVEVNPASGSSTGEHDTITVDVDTAGLSEGSHTCDISISSNGGGGTFAVTVNIIPCEPLLCTDPDPPSHDFGSVSEGQTRDWSFDITNCGSGTLTWTVGEERSWITLTPTSGSTSTETDAITVTIDTTGLQCTNTGTITVSSNDGTKIGTIGVYVTPCIIENEVYLVPQHSTASFCNPTIVQIWINGTDIAGAYINFTYDPACVNVTNVQSANFPRDWDWNSAISGREIIAGTTSDGLNRTGNYLFANLTIHCLSNDCTTNLNFLEGSDLFDQWGASRPATWIEGTFECRSVCGDVNHADDVNYGDVILLRNHLIHGFPISDPWAADVNCQNAINYGDVILLRNHIVQGFPLNCCKQEKRGEKR